MDVGRQHLLMPIGGMASDPSSWKTERSASQPLSPLPPSPFPPSPVPSPAVRAVAEPQERDHADGHDDLNPPAYHSPPPALFLLSPPSSSVSDGTVVPVELSLLRYPVRVHVPHGHSAALARSIYNATTGEDGERSEESAAPASVVWPAPSARPVPLSELSSLSFNCFQYDDDELLLCSGQALQQLQLVAELGLSLPHLQSFLLSVRAHYRSNPYHCFKHGFAVFQFGYFMLTSTRLRALLSPHDQLALLISCLCHDVDHPGTTNQFQVAVDSGLARVHNGKAVLENHHAFVTCEILRHPDSAFLQSWSRARLTAFRTVVVSAILYTDMAKHFKLCRKFPRLEPDLAAYDGSNDADRQLLLNFVTHACDLSAQVMEFDIASQWETRVTAEFNEQAVMEERLGLPVSLMMNGLTNPQVRYTKHVQFLEHIMTPLWRAVAAALPSMQQCIEQLHSNKRQYEQLLTQGDMGAGDQRRLLSARHPTSSSPASIAVSLDPSPSTTEPQSPASLSPKQTLTHPHPPPPFSTSSSSSSSSPPSPSSVAATTTFPHLSFPSSAPVPYDSLPSDDRVDEAERRKEPHSVNDVERRR